MFFYLLLALLAAVAVHAARTGDRNPERIGRLALLYILVGYCGLPMLAVSLATLIWPDRVAEVLGFQAGNPSQAFLGVAFLAMSVLSILALRYRRSFLIAPAVCWAVFFAGATVIHLRDFAVRGVLTHGGALHIFASHGLISLLLVAALLLSGLPRERG